MSRELEIFLHLGTSKTGSTAIQHFFSEHANLSSHQSCYPLSGDLDGVVRGNHIGVAIASGCREMLRVPAVQAALSKSSEDFGMAVLTARKELESYIEKVRVQECKKVILSCEHMCDRLSSIDVRNFTAWFDGLVCKKTAILYVRDPVIAFWSMYRESLKHGETMAFPEFVRSNKNARLAFDYKRIIDVWQETGWELVVRQYRENVQLDCQWSVIDDFLVVTGTNHLVCHNTDLRVNFHAESLNVDDLRFLNRLQRGSLSRVVGKFLRIFKEIPYIKRKSGVSVGDFPEVVAEIRRDFEEGYRSALRMVNF